LKTVIPTPVGAPFFNPAFALIMNIMIQPLKFLERFFFEQLEVKPKQTNTKTIGIIGGAGFIGSYNTQKFLSEDYP